MALYADTGRSTGGLEIRMAKHETLNAAMVAKDDLGEAELRYELLAEAFHDLPQMRSQLNAQLERAKAEILRLRALAKKPGDASEDAGAGKVIAFDAKRFSKSS